MASLMLKCLLRACSSSASAELP